MPVGWKEDACLARSRRVGAWLQAILRALEGSGLAEDQEGTWRLADADALPSSAAILRTIAADHPGRAAELVLAGRLTTGTDGKEAPLDGPSSAALDGFELGGASVRAAGESLLRLLDRADALRLPGLRILQIGYGPLSHALEALTLATQARLTILEGDERRLERARLALRGGRSPSRVPPRRWRQGASTLCSRPRDCIGLLLMRGRSGPCGRRAAPGGLLIAIEPLPSLFRDVTLGLRPGWWEAGSTEFPLSPLRSREEWQRELRACGFDEAEARTIARAPGWRTCCWRAWGRVATTEAVRRSILLHPSRAVAGVQPSPAARRRPGPERA